LQAFAQFRALSDQLYGTPEWHYSVRLEVCFELRQRPNLYREHMRDNKSYHDYCKELQMPGCWGDHTALQVRVLVWAFDGWRWNHI
jgi:hypothetical protein